MSVARVVILCKAAGTRVREKLVRVSPASTKLSVVSTDSEM